MYRATMSRPTAVVRLIEMKMSITLGGIGIMIIIMMMTTKIAKIRSLDPPIIRSIRALPK